MGSHEMSGFLQRVLRVHISHDKAQVLFQLLDDDAQNEMKGHAIFSGLLSLNVLRLALDVDRETDVESIPKAENAIKRLKKKIQGRVMGNNGNGKLTRSGLQNGFDVLDRQGKGKIFPKNVEQVCQDLDIDLNPWGIQLVFYAICGEDAQCFANAIIEGYTLYDLLCWLYPFDDTLAQREIKFLRSMRGKLRKDGDDQVLKNAIWSFFPDLPLFQRKVLEIRYDLYLEKINK